MAINVSDLGPFAPLIRLGGLLVAGAFGSIALLWGKQWGTDSVPAQIRQPFKVAIGATMAAILSIITAYGDYISSYYLVLSLTLLIILMCFSIGAIISRKWQIPVSAMLLALSILSSSMSVLLGSLIVERKVAVHLPTSAPITVVGTPLSADAISLRGVETEKARILLLGTSRWESSVNGPTGIAQFELSALGSSPPAVALISVPFGASTAGIVQERSAQGQLPITIATQDRVPGNAINVGVRLVFCRVDRGAGPVDVPQGQLATCSLSALVRVVSGP